MSHPETPMLSGHSPKRFWLDKLGLTLSAICLIHCLAGSLIFALMPFLKETVLAPFHVGMAVLVIPVGTVAFFRGFRTHHKRWVLIMGLLGLTFISLGVVAPEGLDEILTISGSLLASLGHGLNLRSQPCRSCHTHTFNHTNIKSAVKG